MLRIAVVLLLSSLTIQARAQAPAPAAPPAGAQTAVNTVARAGEVEGLTVNIKVTGPSTQETPLQIACVFEYSEGDITRPPALPAALNGMLHLDLALHGLITDLRSSGKFAGHALETLLITPPKGTIAAERLLLIGLGARKDFSAALMRRVGAVGMREALRLGVTSYSHASDLKDAGVESPTKAVAQAVIEGALDALATQHYLADKDAVPRPALRALTLLAGPAFFSDTTAAARELLARRAQAQH